MQISKKELPLIEFTRKPVKEYLVSINRIGKEILYALQSGLLTVPTIVSGCFTCLDKDCWECKAIRNYRERLKSNKSTGICIGCGLPDCFDDVKIHVGEFGLKCGTRANVFELLMIYRKSQRMQREVSKHYFIEPDLTNPLNFYKWSMTRDFDNQGLFNNMKVIHGMLLAKVLPISQGMMHAF